MLFKPISQFSWEVWYLVNYEFVAEELCENTEEPELQCNGKCFLAKQLAKAELEKDTSSDEEQPVPPFQVKEENICSSSTAAIHAVILPSSDRERDYFKKENPPLQSYHGEVFHPPRT